MRDEDERAGEIVERFGERFAHVEIEMVGRLVEQQKIRPLIHRQCEAQPRFFAAGKRFDGFERAIAGETEAAEKIARFFFADRFVERA